MRYVVVEQYQKAWPKLFEKEAEILSNLFEGLVVDIYHIGSTSVPGLAAKPIIDLLIVVTDIEQVDAFNTQMETCGYKPKGEYGLLGRRYFQKGGDNRTHHVHVYEVGNPEIERHIVFRDYLCAHQKDAARYGKLKLQLAQKYPSDMTSYIDGKNDLVKKLEKQAIAWRNKTL